jgi:hypothetical protein
MNRTRLCRVGYLSEYKMHAGFRTSYNVLIMRRQCRDEISLFVSILLNRMTRYSRVQICFARTARTETASYLHLVSSPIVAMLSSTHARSIVFARGPTISHLPKGIQNIIHLSFMVASPPAMVTLSTVALTSRRQKTDVYS